MSASRAASLASKIPWAKAPYIIGAPMRVMGGPDLALAVSRSGGLGFIGPGAKPEDTITDLKATRKLIEQTPLPHEFSSLSSSLLRLPVGVGFQLWNGDLDTAVRAVDEFKPLAAWLFAPRNGQTDLDEWSIRLREASADTQIWIQIGTVQEAKDILQGKSRPDVVVVQGAEAGGHGRAHDGLGLITLFPEIDDVLSNSGIVLVAAGGIADGRGVAAALSLGARGVALGTRFLASKEARISKGYQQAVVDATDGAKSTARTMIYNHLRGTMGWPEPYSPRGIVNKTYYEHKAGVSFDELKEKYQAAEKAGDDGWGPEGRLATYAGAGVGLVHSVDEAGKIVTGLQEEARNILIQNASFD